LFAVAEIFVPVFDDVGDALFVHGSETGADLLSNR